MLTLSLRRKIMANKRDTNRRKKVAKRLTVEEMLAETKRLQKQEQNLYKDLQKKELTNQERKVKQQ